MLDKAAALLREQKRYHELFEVLKMQTRRRIGLPVLYAESGDSLSDEQRTKLEDGLIAACREVGTLLLEEGQGPRGVDVPAARRRQGRGGEAVGGRSSRARKTTRT